MFSPPGSGRSLAANLDPAAGSPIVAAIDRLARRGLLQTWQRPAISECTCIEIIIGEEIHDALTGAKSDIRALAAEERRIEAAYRAADKDVRSAMLEA